MEFRNVTSPQMCEALAIINQRYDNNITFNRFDVRGKRIFATLKVISAKKDGKGRKLNQSYLMGYTHGFKANGSACWHVHGYFFEALLSVNPNAMIVTMSGRITKDGGNWTDRNIGSIMRPVMYSEACECNEWDNKPMMRLVSQAKLSAECFSVQIWGLTQCETCEFKDTDECGGQQIRKTLKNEKGFDVPL